MVNTKKNFYFGKMKEELIKIYGILEYYTPHMFWDSHGLYIEFHKSVNNVSHCKLLAKIQIQIITFSITQMPGFRGSY